MKKHPFEKFLDKFVPQVAYKHRQLCKATWLQETIASKDATDLASELSLEVGMLFHKKGIYKKLLFWQQDKSLKDPLLRRQLILLLLAFKHTNIPKNLIEKSSKVSGLISRSYCDFRPEYNSKKLTENEIVALLKEEKDPQERKKVWEASKEVGMVLAPHILDLVDVLNQQARSLGYRNYFEKQLEEQEVDQKWLFRTFDHLIKYSEAEYSKLIDEIEEHQTKKYKVSRNSLGPWAWSEPFCQSDPLSSQELDVLVENVDIIESCKRFFKEMSFDLGDVLQNSDMYEHPGKNQHAFCINIDKETDVRVLCNIKPTIEWLESLLHELGHAIYFLNINNNLPWFLRDAPHITNEAIALLGSRQAYRKDALCKLVGISKDKENLMKKAAAASKRRQLIQSRFVIALTVFERELYANPNQDLNKLWWSIVSKYQKVRSPRGREGKCDWAAKMHIGIAPVYCFNYLIGELFASSIEESLVKITGSPELTSKKAGSFLQKKLFHPGTSMTWEELVKNVTGHKLNCKAWIRQFCQ